jgi:glyoxylase-like metal-dependent hydrolase (beta-lactamase superfamily II)
MILETVLVGPLEANCHIVASRQGVAAIIIDPGAEERRIRRILEKHTLKPGIVINTHGHYDHIGADDKFGVPIYIHSLDAAMLRDPMLNLSGIFSLAAQVCSKVVTVEEGTVIEFEGITLKVIHIPGHTPGGIALFLKKPKENVVFTGDNLFAQGIGRSDLPGGDEVALIKAIKEKLFTLPDETIVYPGHGPKTTIGQEKASNPFLM